MARVLNVRTDGVPLGSRLVDRTTPFGNRFRIGRDGTRADVIRKYRIWINKPEQRKLRHRMRRELRGKDLVCWCAPERCHAEIILKVIETGKG